MLSGTNSFSVHTVDGFTIVAKKYGATVKPVNVNGVYSWVVTDVNPADTTDKPGDTYKVTSFKNTNGVTLYDFTWKDEGGTHGTWVFEAKGNFVTLGLPGIWTLASQGSVGQVPTPAADLTSYDSMSREIANLVKVP